MLSQDPHLQTSGMFYYGSVLEWIVILGLYDEEFKNTKLV